MAAPTSHLSLPHFLKRALAENGYHAVGDLSGVSVADLAAELGVGTPQADDVLRQAAALVAASGPSGAAGPSNPSSPSLHPAAGPFSHPHPPEPSHASASAPTTSPARQTQRQTASDLLHAAPGPRFSTLSGALDDLMAHYSPLHLDPHPPGVKGKGRALGGAVVPGMVLEFSGPPGAGKSAVALSMALSGAVGGAEALVIDTEGAMTGERIAAAAQAMLDSLREGVEAAAVEGGGAGADDILGRIHVMRVATQAQMVAVLHTLDGWLEGHPAVKLVVLDTLSFHFRQPALELPARRRIMELIKLCVGKAATVRGCAVVATCQMATKLLTADNRRATFETGERAVLMPALGDAWTTERTVRVALFRGPAGDDLRYAHASTTSAPGNSHGNDPPWAAFDIDTAGLPCDMPPAPTDGDA